MSYAELWPGIDLVYTGAGGQLKSTFNRNSSDPLYISFLDADNSGSVDPQDVGQFKTRFNLNVF